jgi:hypothetical protein
VKLKLGDTMLFGRHTKQFKLSLALSGGAAKAKSSPSPKGNARSEQAAQPLSPSTDGAEVEREKTVTRSTPSSLTHSSKKVASDRNQTDETSAQDKEISGPGKAKLVEPHIKTGQMDTEIPPKKARMSPSKSPASEALIARHGDAAAIVEPDRKNEKAASSTSAADVRYSVYLLHWYKSTHTDAAHPHLDVWAPRLRAASAHHNKKKRKKKGTQWQRRTQRRTWRMKAACLCPHRRSSIKALLSIYYSGSSTAVLKTLFRLYRFSCKTQAARRSAGSLS